MTETNIARASPRLEPEISRGEIVLPVEFTKSEGRKIVLGFDA